MNISDAQKASLDKLKQNIETLIQSPSRLKDLSASFSNDLKDLETLTQK